MDQPDGHSMDGQYHHTWTFAAICDSQVSAKGPVRELHLVIEDLGEAIRISEDLALPADWLLAFRASQG
ncbi:hypothetical protein AB0N14_01335 [Streptomyces sp. NPDC051104]|uniref:hypothetical protein n=1 Tax=Streptomyces sp. NPDC051104 TaxID=3155044 RepID=UPI003414AA9F